MPITGKRKDAHWVDSLPPIGTQCTDCKAGYVIADNFTSAKGDDWERNTCDNCNQPWIKSKPRSKEENKVAKQGRSATASLTGEIVRNTERIVTALQRIYDLLKAQHESQGNLGAKLDEIAGLLADKTMKEEPKE